MSGLQTGHVPYNPDLDFGCTHGDGMGYAISFMHNGRGSVGHPGRPGILPDILTEACMNDLAYPIVYWNWRQGVYD